LEEGKMKKLIVFVGLVAVALFVANAKALTITTNMGGADCEMREESPDSNRGTSTEIASRVSAKSLGASYDHQSLIYLKFNVSSVTEADLMKDIIVRTTIRNTNMAPGRYKDTVEPIGPNTGWDYYVLDPTVPGANWDELTITPNTAPGLYIDGDYTTKPIYDFLGDLNPGLTYLGRRLYDDQYLVSGHLAVGAPFDFVLAPGSALHQAVQTALSTDHKTVTVIMYIAHNADNDNAQWINFNYLFNPKEMTTLNNDPASPWGGMSNANGEFSPSLIFVPEPTTMVLLGLGGLLLRRKS